MAKWGEGDPRWIVEERPDAKNVNNWHWSESDASGWSKTKLKSLLLGLVFKGSEGTCTTVEVVSCKGEATANNRKGKLIFFYEWQIKLKWTGTCTPSSGGEAPDPGTDDEIESKEYSGEIEIPNLSEENEIDDVDVIVTSKKSSKDALNLKELVHKTSPKIVREQLTAYLKSMREEFSKGLILPKNQGGSSQPNNKTPTTSRQNSTASGNLDTPAARSSSSPIGCRIYTARLTLTDSFMSTVEDVFDVLTVQEKVEAYTQNPAVVQAHKGGQYSILSGQITGEFVEVNRPSKIVMRWRQKSWPENHHSKVTIDLTQEATGAKLTLLQTEVPEADLERTKQGWKRHVFQPAKMTFGLGSAPL